MSNSVDNRVVSMEFDNAKFERNVAQSLDTLKHLDKSLDGLVDSSKKFDGVSFEDLANSIDSIASKFTLMGRITMRVFDEIADGIVNLGKKMLSFNIDQISSGWDKYADKTTSVQTIMNATGKDIDYVSTQLERLNRFTDETSYSFTDMTSNIAKFTSQGINLDTAVTQMQGIATWAASAGQNAEAASRAMYNISQAMGAGSMKLIDWKSIQNANMATKEFKEQAIAAGIAAGTLVEKQGEIVTAQGGINVSVKNFESTLQKGWFNTQAMSQVFGEYGKFADEIDNLSVASDGLVSELLQLMEAEQEGTLSIEELEEALGDNATISAEELRAELVRLNGEEYKFSKASYKAAQEAKTWGDAVGAAADAVSTAWMNLYETVFGNYEKARVLWTDVAEFFYDLFAEPINNVNEVVGQVLDNTGKEAKVTSIFNEALKESGISLSDYGSAAEEALKKNGLLTDEMIEAAGGIDQAMKKVTGSSEQFSKVIDDMLANTDKGLKSSEHAFEDYIKTAREVLSGDWGNGQERKDRLKEAGFDYETVQSMATRLHNNLKINADDYERLSVVSSQFTDEQIKALEQLRDRFKENTEAIDDMFIGLNALTGRELLFGKKSFTDDKDGPRGAIYNIMDSILGLQSVVSDAWEDIFGANRVQRIHNFLVSFNAFTAKIRDGILNGDKLGRIFKGLFSVVAIGKSILSATGTVLKNFIKLFTPAGDGLGELAAKFGDWLVGLKDWLEENEVFEKAAQKVSEGFLLIRAALEPVISRVKELWKNFKENDGIKKLTDFLSGVFKAAIDIAVFAIGKLVNGFTKLMTIAKNFYKTYLEGFVTQIQQFFANWNMDKAAEAFENVKNAVVDFFIIFSNYIKTHDYEQFVKDLNDRFGTLAETVKKVRDAISKFFSKDNNGPAKAITILVTALSGLIAVMALIIKFSSVGRSISDFFYSLYDAVKTFQVSLIGNIIIKITASMVLLAMAIKVLADIPAEQLKQAATIMYTMLGIFSGMVLIFAIIEKMKLGPGVTQAVLSITAFALAMAILVGALYTLTNKVDYSNIWRGLGTLAAIMVAFGAVIFVISKYAGFAMLPTAGSLLAFALSVLLICKALEKIQATSIHLSAAAIGNLLTIIGVLSLISFAMKGISFGGSVGLLLFVASLSLVQDLLIKFLDNIIPLTKFQEKWKDFITMIGILLSFATILRIGGNGSIKTAIGILAIVGSVYALAKVAAKIGEIPGAQLAKGTAVILALGVMIGALMFIMALIDHEHLGKGFSASIIALTIGMAALGMELLLLSFIPWKDILPAMAAIATVLGGMALVLLALSKVSKTNHAITDLLPMVAIIVMLVIIFENLKQLSEIENPDTLVKACESIGIIMVALAAAIALMSKSRFEGFNIKSAGSAILQMLSVLIPAMAALAFIDHYNIEASIPTVIALGLLMEALAGAVWILSHSKNYDPGSALANAGVLLLASAAMMGVAVSMMLLNNVNLEGLAEKAISLGGLFLALSGAVVVLSHMPGPASALTALAGVGVVLAAIIGLVAVFAIVGAACSKIQGAADWIITGAELLGGALGKFVGAFVGGVISGAVDLLSDLESFAENLKPVVEALNGFTDQGVAGAKAMVGLLLALSVAEFADAIDNIFGGWLTKLTGTDPWSKLVDFADSAKKFVDKISELPASDVYKASSITNALANLMDSLSREGGLVGAFAGNKSKALENFGKNLGEFGSSISTFGTSISGIDASIVDNAKLVSNAMDPLIEVGNKLGRSGGAWQKIIGEKDISAFGSKLTMFVRMLVGGMHNDGVLNLANAITPELLTNVDKIKTATDALVSAVENIPTLGGFVTVFTGNDSPSAFASEMIKYIDKIKEIATSASGITDETIANINKATEAAGALRTYCVAMGITVPPINTDDLIQTAQGISTSTEVIAESDTQRAANGLEVYGNALKDYVGITADGSFLTSAGNVEIFGQSLGSLKGKAEEGLKGAVGAVQQYGPVLKTAATGAMGSFSSGFDQEQGNLQTTIEGTVTLVKDTLSSGNDSIKESGAQAGDSYMSGFFGSFTECETMEEVLESMKTSLSESNPEVLSIGQSFADGIIAGMNSRHTELETAAKAMVTAIEKAVTEAGAISGGVSEKTVTVPLARKLADGFVKGIKDKLGKVSDAGKLMVDYLVQGINNKETSTEQEGGSIAQPIVDALISSVSLLGADTLLPAGQEIVTLILAGVDASIGSITSAGEAIVTAMVTAMGDKQSDVETASKTLSEAGAAMINNASQYENWKSAGEYVAQGLADGLDAKADAVQAAATRLATIAEIAIRSALGIASPSKVAIGLGEYFGEGFGIGIHNMFSYVHTASESLSETATDAISEAARLASAIVESDANPVITPVLDLSEVRRGAASLSNMGSFAASVSASRANMVYDSAFARTIQNGTPMPTTAVLSDSAIRALAARQTTPNKTVIEFTGDLAQLARVLHPVIVDQYNYHGDKLIN